MVEGEVAAVSVQQQSDERAGGGLRSNTHYLCVPCLHGIHAHSLPVLCLPLVQCQHNVCWIQMLSRVIHLCVCMCVCVREGERKRDRKGEKRMSPEDAGLLLALCVCMCMWHSGHWCHTYPATVALCWCWSGRKASLDGDGWSLIPVVTLQTSRDPDLK